jgi:outer membrane receptor protein involved in Fe transport
MGITKTKTILAYGAALISVMAPSAAWAQQRTFDVPAQSATKSIPEFARQAGIQIVAPGERLRGIRTPKIKGAYDVRAALRTLLAGTNLRIVGDDGNTITLAVKPIPSSQAQTAPGTGDTVSRGAADTDSATSSARDSNDIVVTAQKREQRLFDVPISGVAFSSAEITKRRITTVEDLPYSVPNLSISNTGLNHYIELRGVSNIIGAGSLIGLYLDEADETLGGTAATQINPVVYDLKRIEVLRGPQGTLYGEGSAGGTIRLITNKPDPTKLAFSSDVAALATEGGATSAHVNAMLNIPLVQDELAVRIAATTNHDGGWIDQPAVDRENINGHDLTNVRVQTLWQPSTRFSLAATVVINRDTRSLDVTDQNTPCCWTQQLNFATTPRLKSDYDLYNLTLTYDLPFARLLSTTTYLRASTPAYNQGFSYPLSPLDQSPPYAFYVPLQQTIDHLWTDELRLTSNGSSPWQWSVGGFYRRYRDYSAAPINYYTLPAPDGGPSDPPYAYAFETLYKSWSVFADTSYKLSDSLTVGAGLRYFRDNQDFTDFIALTDQHAAFHSLSPRFYIQYMVSNGVNLYASASKGFRSGGFNQGGQDPFGPESVWTYEIGAKTVLFDGRLDFDTAAYWTSYRNFQSSGVLRGQLGFTYILGVGDARIRGVEWDLNWHPLDDWTLSLRGDYQGTKFTSINANSTNYNVGDPIDLVPKYQFTISAERDFRLGNKSGFARIDYSQQGRETFRNRANGPQYFGESDIIHTLNFNVSLTWNRNLTMGVFGQNLLNDQGFSNPFSVIAGGVRPRPRTFGVDFTTNFD